MLPILILCWVALDLGYNEIEFCYCMKEVKYIVGVQSEHDGAVACDFPKIGRVCLWNKGDKCMFKDREGNPIAIKFDVGILKDMRMKPFYEEVIGASSPKSKSAAPVSEEDAIRQYKEQQEARKRQEALVYPEDKHEKTPVQSIVEGTINPSKREEFIENNSVNVDIVEAGDLDLNAVDSVNMAATLTEGETQVDPWTCYLDTESTPNVWKLVKDNFTSHSPAGIKSHVRSIYGKDSVEKIKWVK